MKVLNLVYPEKSDIKYKVSNFPDGQSNIAIEDWCEGIKGYLPSSPNSKSSVAIYEDNIVQIKSRLNNFKEVELLICATKALRGLGVKEIGLYAPYFLGSRSDRLFETGSVNYLKEVICPIINSLEFDSVTVIDPHSDVLEACLDNFNKQSNENLVRFALCDIYPTDKKELPKGLLSNGLIVSPDAGSLKKIYKLQNLIGGVEVIVCSKDRDHEGKLSRTIVPISGKQHQKDLIIIDDICDGGATFINIVKKIREMQESFKTPPNKIYLVVTHGIFSKGFEELNKHFEGIYCTNSYKDIADYAMIGGPTKLKQLNVF